MRSVAVVLVFVGLASSEFNFDDCGKTKKCVGIKDCKTLDNSCVAASFKIQDDYKHIEWELSGPVVEDGGSFVALGLSANDKMGDDFVVECSKLTDEKIHSVKLSYNSPKDATHPSPTNIRIPDEENARPSRVTSTSATATNGFLYCKATVLADGTGGEKYYKLTKGEKKTILLAAGTTNKNGLNSHGMANPHSSAGEVAMENSSGRVLSSLSFLLVAIVRFH